MPTTTTLILQKKTPLRLLMSYSYENSPKIHFSEASTCSMWKSQVACYIFEVSYLDLATGECGMIGCAIFRIDEIGSCKRVT